ncbi:hypothetical protein BDM02DRAFT_3267830 [Thelephora ganbajun]|uniref:Uncharacterized protein n=1 Tax=Thelephora ganbajun TaxID=370292 RepID=A0ACB6ZMF7_THEGA|nr:hypothetical protein BDM02DRAFT_3267830 [Thelephora ganbajun]
MLRLSSRRSTSSSRRVQVCSYYATFPRRWQTSKAKSHASKDHHASKAHSRYPFPTHPNPTPFQILHLPTNASSEAIKARYYELVKVYHPDVVVASLSQDSPTSAEQGVSSSATLPEEHLTPELAQARFQAVTKAYDSLRKDATESRMSARRKRYLRARAELRVGDDEKWRERLIVGALFATMMVFVYQTFETRREGLAIAAAANSRANGKRRQLEEALAVYPPPKDPTTSTRSKRTIEDENRLAAAQDT